jgi:hypothetical protein
MKGGDGEIDSRASFCAVMITLGRRLHCRPYDFEGPLHHRHSVSSRQDLASPASPFPCSACRWTALSIAASKALRNRVPYSASPRVEAVSGCMSYLRSMERQPGPLRKAGFPEQGSRLLVPPSSRSQVLPPGRRPSILQHGNRHQNPEADSLRMSLARTEITRVTMHIRSLLVEMMLQPLPIGSLVLALPALARWQ